MKKSQHDSSNRPLRELAYRHLQSKLVTGSLVSGSVLSEVALSKELGVSRTPLREAIGQLVAEGFLEQLPSRGTVVAQGTRRDIVELYELREALEVYAVAQVAKARLRDEVAAELHRIVDAVLDLRNRLESTGLPRLDASKMRSFVNIDLAFHAGLLRAGGNGRILRVVADTRLLIRIFSMLHEGHTAAQLTDIHAYHDRILKAVLAGESGQARELMAEHIRLSREERLAAYDEWERQLSLNRAVGDDWLDRGGL